jgi:putative pyruvate formate lyase activating enzyme
MEKFYETKQIIDKRKLKISDLEIPSHSLLDLKVFLAKDILKKCDLCDFRCNKNRSGGERGVCGATNMSFIASDDILFDEEIYISPSNSILFAGCNFDCQFCQSWETSRSFESGYPVIPSQLAKSIEKSRKYGARNVKFSGGEPTPHLLTILQILSNCRSNVPTVWNSNFFMSGKAMTLLGGVVDMYLSDFKYGNNECAKLFSKAPSYFETVTRNLLLAEKNGEMSIRHLVMPEHFECCTKPVLDWVAENMMGSMVNIMDRYRPEFKAGLFTDINRGITQEEFEEALRYSEGLNLNCLK